MTAYHCTTKRCRNYHVEVDTPLAPAEIRSYTGRSLTCVGCGQPMRLKPAAEGPIMERPHCRGCGEDFEGATLFCDRCRTQDVFGGYTREQLSEAFDLVRDLTNWKHRIVANIPADQARVVEAAIAFFGGGRASFSQNNDGTLHVTAPGYYATIGS